MVRAAKAEDEMWDWIERCDEVFGVRVDVELNGEENGWREGLEYKVDIERLCLGQDG